MEKYGSNIKSVLRHHKTKMFGYKTTVQIGIQLLERLKDLHSIGYLHLDLKPDNILLGSTNKSKPESSVITLIDFGIAKKYITQTGEHIKED